MSHRAARNGRCRPIIRPWAYYPYGHHQATPLFTENESNAQTLWGQPNATPYVKDAFHRYLIHGAADAVNPAQVGTKFAAAHVFTVEPGQTVFIGLTLAREAALVDVDFAKDQIEILLKEDYLSSNGQIPACRKVIR